MTLLEFYRVRVLACVCCAVMGGNAVADSPELLIPELDLGWTWELEPQEFDTWWITAGYTRHVDSGLLSLTAGLDNTVVVLHLHARSEEFYGSDQVNFQVHLITRSGKRPMVRQSIYMPSERIEASRQVHVVEDHEDVIGVGLSVLTPEGRRQQVAHYAEMADAAGVAVLPAPVVDELLSIDVEDTDGVSHTSKSLRGEVVLFVAWASWCGPCIEKVPEIRELHRSYAEAGLRIIGLNFDREWRDAQVAVDEHGMAWPHVHAAVDEIHRKFWSRITGITTIPRLIVVDREGVVRADNPEEDLDEVIATLLR